MASKPKTTTNSAKTPKPVAQAAGATSTGSSFLVPGIAIVVIVILILVVGFFTLSGTRSTQQQINAFPQFPNTSAPVPTTLTGILSQSGEQINAKLASLAQTQRSNATQFSVSYLGFMYLKPAGLIGDIAKVSTPLYINESRFGSNTRMYLNATTLPLIGNGQMTYLNISQGSFLCSNFNVTAASHGSVSGTSSSKNITCRNVSSIAGVSLSKLAKFNLTLLQDEGMNITYNREYQSTYKQTPCTFFQGTISQMASNGSTIGTGDFEMCVSDVYYVPLSMAIVFNGNSGNLAVNLNETTISNSSQQSYVESLPGPVV